MSAIDSRPLVSIGLPVYNGEEILPTALDSLLTQSYSHLEGVLCDTPSTEGTAAPSERCPPSGGGPGPNRPSGWARRYLPRVRRPGPAHPPLPQRSEHWRP